MTKAIPKLKLHGLGAILVMAASFQGCADPQFAAQQPDGSEKGLGDASCRGAACGEPSGPSAHDADVPRDALLPLDGGAPEEAGSGGASNDGASAEAGGNMSTDAAPDPASGWKRQLEGLYMVRARFYGRAGNDSGRIANELVWRAKVELGANDNPVMHLHLCADRGHLESIALVQARLVAPESYPDRELRVVEENGVIRTVGAAQAVGYEEANPSACGPNLKIAARPEQVWISGGQCECSNPDVLPTSADDCRVTDPDGDRNPGMTIETSGAVRNQEYFRTKDLSQFLNITVRSDRRHVSNFAKVEELRQLGCSGTRCAVTTLSLCRPELNRALFVPLESGVEADWPCSKLLRGLDDGSLLPPEPLKAPSDC